MAEPSNCNKNKIYKCLNRRVIPNGKFSTRADVLRGAPQGSVLGPLLFVIFIYDIDDAMIQDFRKFPDDTKVGQTMTSAEDKDKLQAALDALCGWANLWGMEFNIPNCKIVF
jgi:ribonuclease P/MRP protein subunit RPP40